MPKRETLTDANSFDRKQIYCLTSVLCPRSVGRWFFGRWGNRTVVLNHRFTLPPRHILSDIYHHYGPNTAIFLLGVPRTELSGWNERV